MKKAKRRAFWLRALALAVCTLPVAVCVLLYFPRWQRLGGGSIISGFFLLLLILCAVPLFNYVKTRLATPAAHTMWFIAFLIFFTLASIANEMTVISFVGFISNLCGSFIFRWADGIEKGKDEEE